MFSFFGFQPLVLVCVCVFVYVRSRREDFFYSSTRGNLAATISQAAVSQLFTRLAQEIEDNSFSFLRLEDPPGEMFELYKWLALRDFVCLFVFFCKQRGRFNGYE